MKIVHTDGSNRDFREMCRLLDENLNEIVGGEVQREKYDQYNATDKINHAVLIYLDDLPVASGAFRYYEDSVGEVKRIFVRKEYRGRGLSKVLMRELETLARGEGYGKLILETGQLLSVSMNLYRSVGFSLRENYGPYEDMEESVCMEKVLAP